MCVDNLSEYETSRNKIVDFELVLELKLDSTRVLEHGGAFPMDKNKLSEYEMILNTVVECELELKLGRYTM